MGLIDLIRGVFARLTRPKLIIVRSKVAETDLAFPEDFARDMADLEN